MSNTANIIYSDPFYSSKNGHFLTGKLYLNGNGDGENTHLSLYIVVKKGKYDDIIDWPLDKEITFTLFNQGDKPHHKYSFNSDLASPSFEKPKNSDNIASGNPLFFKIGELLPSGFMKNGKIFIKIDVKPRTRWTTLP